MSFQSTSKEIPILGSSLGGNIGWRCPRCTFENGESLNQCDMCDQGRGGDGGGGGGGDGNLAQALEESRREEELEKLNLAMALSASLADGGGSAREEKAKAKAGAVKNDDDTIRVDISVVNAISGEEVAYLEGWDPATTTIKDVKRALYAARSDYPVFNMRLFYQGEGGGGGGGAALSLEDDDVLLAGLDGDGGDVDIYTLQVVLVATGESEKHREEYFKLRGLTDENLRFLRSDMMVVLYEEDYIVTINYINTGVPAFKQPDICIHFPSGRSGTMYYMDQWSPALGPLDIARHLANKIDEIRTASNDGQGLVYLVMGQSKVGSFRNTFPEEYPFLRDAGGAGN